MPNGGTEFATGAFRGLTASVSKWEAKRDRKRRLQALERYYKDIQAWQTEGKAITPERAAEYAGHGFPVPHEAMRGFDPSTLKGPGTAQVSVLGGAPFDVPVQQDTPESREFESGALTFREASAAQATREADQVVAQREAEARIEMNRVIEVSGRIPARQKTPTQLVDEYDALIGTDQKGAAATLLRDARTITKETGGGDKPDPDSAAWKAIEDKAARGNNDISDYTQPEKTMLIKMFPDEKDRADWLGSGADGIKIWKYGVAGIRGQIDIMFRHEMYYTQALQAWMTNDPGMKVTVQQFNLLEATHDKRTGEIKPKAIVKYGRRVNDVIEENMKRAAVPTQVAAFVKDLVTSYYEKYRGVPVSERPIPPYQSWQAELNVRGITYDLGKIITLFEQTLAEAEAIQPTR